MTATRRRFSIAQLMRDHLARLILIQTGAPKFADIRTRLESLTSPNTFAVMRAVLAIELNRALDYRVHTSLAFMEPMCDYICSAIPAADTKQARDFLEGNYIGVVSRLALRKTQKVNLIHWVLCSDGTDASIYATVLLPSALVAVPHDLLPDIEGQQRSQRGARDPALGMLFWFDWRAISATGFPLYGRYVYLRLMHHLSTLNIRTQQVCYLFDGDCLPKSDLHLPYAGHEESKTLDLLTEVGIENCFVIAAYGDGYVLRELKRRLSLEEPTGFLGVNTCHNTNLREFVDLAASMSLPYAGSLRSRTFEKRSFGYITDEELRLLDIEPETP